MLRITCFLLLCSTQWASVASAFLNHQHLRRQLSTGGYSGYTVPSYNISIPVDHFNASDNRTYNNQYWVNDTYYQPGGPIFFYDNGELGVTEQRAAQAIGGINTTSNPLRLAQRYNGTVIFWEHRYYGLSFPVPRNVTTHEPVGGLSGYQYLTVDQALEDVVYFANNWKPANCTGDQCDMVRPSRTPWIWVGGSYPGIRGAFMRVRNPEIIYASWASSAPVEARFDGSPWTTAPAEAMPSNCSADVLAAVKYADQIMSGDFDESTYQNLQRLNYLASILETGFDRSYNLTNAATYSPYAIGSDMSQSLDGHGVYQSYGPSVTTQLFCDYLESYNPDGSASNTSNGYLTVLSNAGNRQLTADSLITTYNSSVVLDAFFYASRRFAQYYYEVLSMSGVVEENPPDLIADILSWRYQTLSEFGWFQGSNPDNVTIVSRYYNASTIRVNAAELFYTDISASDFPNPPNASAFNQYGGWNMTPSNVMFTDGEIDPWRGGTVLSEETWIGAPVRKVTDSIPQCGKAPNGTNVFGMVYSGAVHVPDISQNASLPLDASTPVEQGFQLFTRALDAWLPCFNASGT